MRGLSAYPGAACSLLCSFRSSPLPVLVRGALAHRFWRRVSPLEHEKVREPEALEPGFLHFVGHALEEVAGAFVARDHVVVAGKYHRPVDPAAIQARG